MKSWKELPKAHKIAMILACISVLLMLLHVVKPELLPIDPICLAIAVVTVCEAVGHWKTNRKWAYLLIGAAVISAVCFILELVLML